MKKRMLFITLILLMGILLANPGRDNHRNDQHKNTRSKHNKGKKVIVVKPHAQKFVFRFNVNPHGRYYNHRNYRNLSYHFRMYDSRSRYNDGRRNYRFKDWEIVKRRDVEPLLYKLGRYYERGLINKKEYHFAREELWKMVGKLYPEDYAEDYIEEVIEQIADLYKLRRRGMISLYEAQYKNKLLKRL